MKVSTLKSGDFADILGGLCEELILLSSDAGFSEKRLLTAKFA
jgi:hypothetical protein